MNTEVQKINVDNIVPNRFQPRKNFDEESLEELANSIRQHGIIQPLVLRKLGESFEIIAGERRYKAAIKVGLKEVPAIVMDLDDTSSAEIALVENIQRKDLTAIEEAKSYEKILELGQMNQDELAKRVGKKQSTVSNKLRLLNLSEEAQQALLDNKISERHARSLLRLKDKLTQNEMLGKIIDNRLTVRETDSEIKNILGETNTITPDDEIIDFQSDGISSNTEEADSQNSYISPETKNIELNEPKMINQNNPVFINPTIIPPEDLNQNNNIQNENLQYQQNLNIPEYDQIGINQNIPNNNDNNNLQNFNSTNPIGGKFFNLDDEAANMNMGNTYPDSNQLVQNIDPNTIEHQNNMQENNFYQNIPANSGETNNYNSNINIPPQPMIAQQDITGAVAVIRNTTMNLQNNGYIININEEDTTDSHKIIIDIKK